MRTLGLIGGSGLLKTQLAALQGLTEEVVDTPSGRVFLRVGSLGGGARLVFVQRHDASPSRVYTQPADINYAAIALALQAKVRLGSLVGEGYGGHRGAWRCCGICAALQSLLWVFAASLLWAVTATLPSLP